MTKLFAIAIGYDDADGSHFANVHSLTDDKIAKVQNKNANRVLRDVSKLVSDKLREMQKFPLPVTPEPSRIITPNGNDGPRLSIVTP